MSNLINTIVSMSPIILMLSTPLIIAALGGLYSERSGIVNIALEACMTIGAFIAGVFLYFFSNANVPFAAYITLLLCGLGGMIFVSLHAFAAIHCRADQTVSGTALNVLSIGFTVYICEIIFDKKSTDAFNQFVSIRRVSIPLLKDIPLIGDLFFKDTYPTFYLALLLVIITWFIMNKTVFGLRLKSCGEFPQASASMGINVVKMRWIGVLISGFLAGVAGGVLLMTTQTFFQQTSVHGIGFVAIATLIFGKWKAWGIFFAAIFFGFAQALGLFSTTIPYINFLPEYFFLAFPYIVTIIAIIITSGKSKGPKAAGEIYDASKR